MTPEQAFVVGVELGRLASVSASLSRLREQLESDADRMVFDAWLRRLAGALTTLVLEAPTDLPPDLRGAIAAVVAAIPEPVPGGLLALEWADPASPWRC